MLSYWGVSLFPRLETMLDEQVMCAGVRGLPAKNPEHLQLRCLTECPSYADGEAAICLC